MCYNGCMSVRLSNQALDQLDKSPREVLHVERPGTKRKYVLLSQEVYDRARPLFDYVATQTAHQPSPAKDEPQWTEAMNARRVALVNKKHDTELTPAERHELEELQQAAYRHRSQVAPIRNGVLRAILEALEKAEAEQLSAKPL